eukprot:m.82043 g.82043  ORF g.82043 m.82043 type:complete len:422 (+) comp12074_c0_seq8:214-1479(+)
MLFHQRRQLLLIGVSVFVLMTFIYLYVGPSSSPTSPLDGGNTGRAVALRGENENTENIQQLHAGLVRVESKINHMMERVDEFNEKHDNLTKLLLKQQDIIQNKHDQFVKVAKSHEHLLDAFDLDGLVQNIQKEFIKRLNSGLNAGAIEGNNGVVDSEEEEKRLKEDHSNLRPGQIRYAENFFCMDGYDDERLIIYMCNRDQPLQFWQFTDRNQFRLSENNKCMDTTGLVEGDAVKMRPCDGSNEQQKFEVVGAKTYTFTRTSQIKAKGSNLCLTNPSFFGSDIASVTLESCTFEKRCRQTFVCNAKVGASSTVLHTLSKGHEPETPLVYNKKTMKGKGGKILCWIMTNPSNHNNKWVAQSCLYLCSCNCCVCSCNYCVIVFQSGDSEGDVGKTLRQDCVCDNSNSSEIGHLDRLITGEGVS